MGDWGGSWGQAYVANQAGKASEMAADQALQWSQQVYGVTQQQIAPAIDTYQQMNTMLSQGMQPGGQFNKPFVYDPSNPQAQAEQQYVSSMGAATGQTFSGNQLAAAANAGGGDYAQQYNMFETDLNRQYNEMFNLDNIGLNAALGVGTQGLTAAGQSGQFGITAAQSAGAGQIGAASALNQGTTNAFNSWGGIAGLAQGWGSGVYSAPAGSGSLDMSTAKNVDQYDNVFSSP